MAITDEVSAVLVTAETKLRELAQEALREGDYNSVPLLAELAKSIAELRRSQLASAFVDTALTSPHDVAAIRRTEASLNNDSVTGKLRTTKSDFASSFPRFERQGKRLVKLGWSSKDRRIYEQRTPYEIVLDICRRFEEKAGPKKLLKIEKLLPMKTETGDEIPSYQVYLVLKWLQENGAVTRQGKDGYSVADSGIDLKALWEKTESR